MKIPVYMDYHATTPVDSRVLDEMMPYFREHFGNSHSTSHVFGSKAGESVEKARERIASLIGVKSPAIIFTSGATESNNIVIKGVANRLWNRGNHIITSVIEHPSVLETCRYLEKNGCEISYIPVTGDGFVQTDVLENSIRKETILISIMSANNEIGVIQPLAEIGRIAKKYHVLFHSDAAQSAGKIPLNINETAIDFLSFSAHKFYGPKGAGALVMTIKNPSEILVPLFHGGGQENGMRSGTLNVPGIVGLGKACEIAEKELEIEGERVEELRERLKSGIMNALDEVYLNGHAHKRLPGNLNLSFAGVDAESMLNGLKDIAMSAGSACRTEEIEPSYVLKAIGVKRELALSTLRFGIGRFTAQDEVDHVIGRVVETVRKLRALRK